MNSTNYNFQADLRMEANPIAQNTLQNFYKFHLPQYTVSKVEYEGLLGKTLQTMGVDKIATQYNVFGNIEHQLLIQEKIRANVKFKQYNDIIFEIEKKSGKQGWAIAPEEKADFLVVYYSDVILLMKMDEIKAWLGNPDTLETYKNKYAFPTDNYNLKVPLHEVEQHITVKQYQTNFFRQENRQYGEQTKVLCSIQEGAC